MFTSRLLPRLLLVAASTPLLAAYVPAQGGDEVVRWLPPNSIVHVEINGGPCSRAGEELALAKIWNEPEMQQFFQNALQMAGPFWQMGMMQMQGMLGIPPEAVDALLRGRITATWCGQIHGSNEAGTGAWDIPDAVFTWDYAEDPDAIAAVMSALENLAVSNQVAAFSDEAVEGVTVRRMQLQDMLFPLYYVVDGAGLIFASSRDTLAGCLARRKSGAPGLAASAGFQESWMRTHRANTVVYAYADVAGILRMLQASGAMPPEAAQFLPLIPYRSLAFGEDLDGAGLWDRLYVGFVPNSPMRQLLAPRDRLQTLDMVPAGTGFYSAWTVSYTGMYDWWLNLAESVHPGAKAMLEQHIAQGEAHLGFKLRDDLLAKLGPEAALCLSFPEHGLIPDVHLLVESSDPAGLQGILEKLLLSGFKGAQVRTVKFGQDTIRYMDLARSPQWREQMDAVALRPSWVVMDRYLLVTLWPQSAKNFLANVRGNGPKLSQNPDFAALAGRRSGAPGGMQLQSIGYLDFRGLAGFLLDNTVPAMQSFTPALPAQVPVDVGNWPRTEVFTRHLFGMFTRRGVVDEGLYSETYSPTGLVLPMAALAGGGAAAWMQARQVHSMAAPGHAVEEY
ncbi:MAG: hypothetical protein EYC70_08190 [Planctomycetota bacterium]|nr:MAG: hypothetical protein EYC70_08190 [Planctomycetota bacterium]